MNVKAVLGLLLAIAITTGSVPRVSCEGTVLSVPLLFRPPNDTGGCRDVGSGGKHNLVVTSQDYNHLTKSNLYLHAPPCNYCERCYYKILQPNIEHYMHTFDFNACRTDIKCASWLTLCEKNVFGINLQIFDNPSFSAIYISFTPNSQQCLAVYPLPMQPAPQNRSISYIYHIFHGRQQLKKAKLNGLTIQNPYDTDSDISIDLTGSAVGWENGKTLISVGSMLRLKCREVLWLQPASDIAESQSLSLSGTILSSSSPLNIFTNSAAFDSSGAISGNFEYDSQLVHQMPERSHWGKQHIIDGRFSDVLPDELSSCLVYEVTIVSYTSRNEISLSSNLSQELATPTRNTSEQHHEYRLIYSHSQMTQMSFLAINSVFPVLVLSEAYSSTAYTNCQDNPVLYSALVQPVAWHSNKQVVVLVHPQENTTYSYYISISVPTENSNPSDIFESEQNQYCQGLSISSHVVSSHPAGENYMLLSYKKSVVNSGTNQTKLLLRHSDPNTSMGVTVYAYSEDLQYSYSNGYVLVDDSVDDRNICIQPTVKTITPSHTEVLTLSSILMVVMTLVITVVVVVVRRHIKAKGKCHSASNLIPLDSEYQYDIFILCADEDEGFVTECIEGPLSKHGYITTRKNTAPEGLFMAGNTIVSDIEHMLTLCWKVIVICSADYCSEGRASGSHCSMEINCCKETTSCGIGKVIPIVLDGVDAVDFEEFTQHRISTTDIMSNSDSRRVFVEKLERDIGIKRG